MRRLLLVMALTFAAGGVSPLAAQASDDSGLPLTEPPSLSAVPPGFTTNARQAIAVAKTSPVLRSFHRTVHPLNIQPTIWANDRWFIAFYHRGIVAAEADVSRDGRLLDAWTGPQARALYTHGNYSPLFDSPWVIGIFSLLFALPFLARRGLLRVSHVDALALGGFVASYVVFNGGHLEPSVWMAYPPMLYLLGRLLWIGMRRRPERDLRLPSFSPRLLGFALLVLVLGREALSLTNREVIDVGYASVVGAARILHGHSLYFWSTGHGDTYGPIAYLAYVPFEMLFPWNGHWGYLPAAHVANVVFDLATIGGLIVLGRQMREGSDGTRLGLLLAWGWAACPFTLLAMMMHTNDGLVSMLCVFGLVAFASPAARGTLLGLAAAAKFSPAVLLPLFAGGPRRSWRAAAVCGGCFALVVVASIALYLPSGGLQEFWDHTIGYQLHRADVFSPWALHPGLHPIATMLELAAVLLAAVVALRPRERDLAQVCALAGAVTIAVQLPALHWFYYYIDWFLPFVLVATLAPRELRVREAVTAREREPQVAGASVLAGA